MSYDTVASLQRMQQLEQASVISTIFKVLRFIPFFRYIISYLPLACRLL